jgi:FMN phosphatase YigB (HAD superfamily)
LFVHKATTLLLDFDGTLCLGDDPVRAYADAVASYLDAAAADAFSSAVDAYLAGNSGDTFVDGYVAVHAHVAGRIAATDMAAAYLASRQKLADGTLDVHPPAGLAEFLSEAGEHSRIAVATNAPELGIDETLRAFGVAQYVDTVVTDSAKPDGMDVILDGLLEDRLPQSLLSVGDIWANDLAVPHRRGCRTAFIDRWGYDDGRATFVAARFEDLYRDILRWSTAPTEFHALLASDKGTS